LTVAEASRYSARVTAATLRRRHSGDELPTLLPDLTTYAAGLVPGEPLRPLSTGDIEAAITAADAA
jgi:hypothetical protein